MRPVVFYWMVVVGVAGIGVVWYRWRKNAERFK